MKLLLIYMAYLLLSLSKLHAEELEVYICGWEGDEYNCTLIDDKPSKKNYEKEIQEDVEDLCLDLLSC